jgi:hypothetical protein
MVPYFLDFFNDALDDNRIKWIYAVLAGNGESKQIPNSISHKLQPYIERALSKPYNPMWPSLPEECTMYKHHYYIPHSVPAFK